MPPPSRNNPPSGFRLSVSGEFLNPQSKLIFKPELSVSSLFFNHFRPGAFYFSPAGAGISRQTTLGQKRQRAGHLGRGAQGLESWNMGGRLEAGRDPQLMLGLSLHLSLKASGGRLTDWGSRVMQKYEVTYK